MGELSFELRNFNHGCKRLRGKHLATGLFLDEIVLQVDAKARIHSVTLQANFLEHPGFARDPPEKESQFFVFIFSISRSLSLLIVCLTVLEHLIFAQNQSENRVAIKPIINDCLSV